MKPAARIQAAIELLTEIGARDQPADLLARDYFRTRRYIGSKDRRAVSDLVYRVLRHRARLDWWLERAGGAVSPRGRVLAELALVDGMARDALAASFDGARYHPAALTEAEAAIVAALDGGALEHAEQPAAVRAEVAPWLYKRLAAAFGGEVETELAALGREAGLDLRVNSLKTDRATAARALAAEGIETEPTPLAPLGLRVRGRHVLPSLGAFRDGLVEVQDEGAQLAALLCDARPGMAVADYCAGAGGKTLALAAQMADQGRLVALDTDPARLKRAAPRLARAGVGVAELRGLKEGGDAWLAGQAGAFDRVLVDAPCSGSGTWRRQPDARWRLSVADLNRVFAVQRRILAAAATLVRRGGRLIYVTCGLLPEENQDQVARFLRSAPDFALLPVASVWAETLGAETLGAETLGAETGGGSCPAAGETLLLTPARHGTDGFFVAVMQRGDGA